MMSKSAMEEAANGQEGISVEIKGPHQNMLKLLDNKLSIKDFEDRLVKLSSKYEMEMVLRQNHIMHL